MDVLVNIVYTEKIFRSLCGGLYRCLCRKFRCLCRMRGISVEDTDGGPLETQKTGLWTNKYLFWNYIYPFIEDTNMCSGFTGGASTIISTMNHTAGLVSTPWVILVQIHWLQARNAKTVHYVAWPLFLVWPHPYLQLFLNHTYLWVKKTMRVCAVATSGMFTPARCSMPAMWSVYFY